MFSGDSLLDKVFVRSTTDIPLHERFHRLSQIHTQLSMSSRKGSNRGSSSIAPDEVRIQIRPFKTDTNPPVRSSQFYRRQPTTSGASVSTSGSLMRSASNFTADRMQEASFQSSRMESQRSSNRLSAVSPKTRKPGTMVMDMKPRTLSERLLQNIKLGRSGNTTTKSSLNSVQKSPKDKNQVKRKAVQRLGVQARLGNKNPAISAKQRLALTAVSLGSAKGRLVGTGGNFNQSGNQFKSRKYQLGNNTQMKSNKFSLNNTNKKEVKKADKGSRKAEPSMNDLDKELEEFMSTK